MVAMNKKVIPIPRRLCIEYWERMAIAIEKTLFPDAFLGIFRRHIEIKVRLRR